MIRLSILALFLLCLWGYAFRDWFVSLCALILLTVLTQNHNVPQYMFGIQGLNPWNVSLLIITLAWLVQRPQGRMAWNVPRLGTVIVAGYLTVLFVAYVQLVGSLDSLPATVKDRTFLGVTSDMLINPVKYIWVAVLLADGCTTRTRVRLAIATILALGVLYGLFVLKQIPISSLFGAGAGDFMAYRQKIDKLIGLHANDMAKVLVLTFWGVLVSAGVWRQRYFKIAVISSAAVCWVGVALCYSRTGYVTFLVTGFVVACVRWRKLLIIGPVALLVFCLVFPSVVQRSAMGFGSVAPFGDGATNWNEVSAGRTGNLWPPTIQAIGEAPLFGHGRLAILTTSAHDKILELEGTVPRSPHNGYLEILVDSGFLGMTVVGAFYIGVLSVSWLLLVRQKDRLLIAVGAVGLVHSTGCLVAALGGASLWPDQGMLGALCAFSVALRVWCRQYRYGQRPAGLKPCRKTRSLQRVCVEGLRQ